MNTDLFRVVWLLIVASVIFWQGAWVWRAWRAGIATDNIFNVRARSDEPVRFWMLLAVRMVVLFVGIVMFVVGTQFLLKAL